MAATVLLGTTLQVNGVDLTAYATNIKVTRADRDVKDSTTFGSGGYEQNVLGINKIRITAKLNNAYGAGLVNATCGALAVAGTEFTVRVRAFNAAISATNPEWVMAGALLPSFVSLDGGVGDVTTTDVEFVPGPNFTGLVENLV
jgi:hypothetical protein